MIEFEKMGGKEEIRSSLLSMEKESDFVELGRAWVCVPNKMKKKGREKKIALAAQSGRTRPKERMILFLIF